MAEKTKYYYRSLMTLPLCQWPLVLCCAEVYKHVAVCAMAEEWPPLFTYILYNIAHRLQARRKRWMLWCKHDSLPCLQIFDTLVLQ